MQRHRPWVWFALILGACAVLLGACRPVAADGDPQPKPYARQLLYPAKAEDVPEGLRPFVARVLDPEQGPVEPGDVKPSGVYMRVVTRNYILDGVALKKGGVLGGKPFVFAAHPETLYGRSLLQIYSAIGYSPEDVLTGELGAEKVAVIFRWEEKVCAHEGRDGKLPEAWQTAIYSPTWDNVFALVDRMAGDKEWHYVREADRPADLTKLQFASAKEGQFVLSFPDAGKQRIKSTSYSALKETKGADWEYRQFLERSMSLASHFTGDGTSQPTIVGQGKAHRGFPEFIGPNRELTALPEVAVISLGALRVVEK